MLSLIIAVCISLNFSRLVNCILLTSIGGESDGGIVLGSILSSDVSEMVSVSIFWMCSLVCACFGFCCSAIDCIGVGPLPELGLVLDSGDDPWSSLSACGTGGW